MGEGSSAGSQSNTMWPGPRPTGMPSFILIHPTIWPQYTSITDRQTGQTDRQRFDSIRRTDFGRPFAKRFALCCKTFVSLSVCLSVLSVTLVYCGKTVGCIKIQDETWRASRPRPWPHCVRLEPGSPPQKGHSLPIFGPYLLWPNGWMGGRPW